LDITTFDIAFPIADILQISKSIGP